MKKALLLFLSIVLCFSLCSFESVALEPPATMDFDDWDQLRRFVKSANGSAWDYMNYVFSIEPRSRPYISQKHAKEIADTLCAQPLLVSKHEAKGENASTATWYIDDDYIYFHFDVNGIKYSVDYYLSIDESDQSNDKHLTSPVKSEAIGPYTVHFYKSEPIATFYWGSFIHENGKITIRVFTSDPDEITLEDFYFEDLDPENKPSLVTLLQAKLASSLVLRNEQSSEKPHIAHLLYFFTVRILPYIPQEEPVIDRSWYSINDGDDLSFDSISDLKRYFREKDPFGNHLAVIDPIYEQYPRYQRFVNEILTSGKIVVPYMNGKEVTIRKESDDARVSLITYEWFKQPWIWFQCESKRAEQRIQIMYIPEEHLSKDYIVSASAFIKNVAPNYPHLENAESHEEIESVYETQLVLSDRTVTSLAHKYKGDLRIYYSFIYDNLFIRVVGYRTELNDNWFKGLSFAEIPIS